MRLASERTTVTASSRSRSRVARIFSILCLARLTIDGEREFAISRGLNASSLKCLKSGEQNRDGIIQIDGHRFRVCCVAQVVVDPWQQVPAWRVAAQPGYDPPPPNVGASSCGLMFIIWESYLVVHFISTSYISGSRA